MKQNVKVDYDVVSDIAGHQPNKQVELEMAATDIFAKVKNKAMEVAVKGDFQDFNTIEELEDILRQGVMKGYSIRVFDENIGG